MKEVFVVRHGQCTDNEAGILNGQRDTELTGLGKSQAKKLGMQISEAGLKIDAIYSSTLRRAALTAEIIARCVHDPVLPVTQSAVLIERRLGNVEGMSITDACRRILPEHLIRTPHGVTYADDSRYGFETFEEITERLARFWRDIHETHPGNAAILAVTHGDAAIALAAAASGISMRELIHRFHLPNTGVLRIAPTGDFELMELPDTDPNTGGTILTEAYG